jgi:hypothetical protein
MQLNKDLERMRIWVTLQTLAQYSHIAVTDTATRDTSKSTKYAS